MSKSEKKPSASELDLRVRDRLLANGTLDAKQIEKHLAELPDLESACEVIDMAQPALESDIDEA